MTARKRTRKVFSLVTADYKDTEGLLNELSDELARFGVNLQVHDMGWDDWCVTVTKFPTKVTARDVAEHFGME